MARRVLVPAGIAVAVGLALAVVATAPAAGAEPDGAPPLPAVHPVPQSMQARGGLMPLGTAVELDTGPSSDPAAVSAVRDVLRTAGVQRIDENGAGATDPDEPVIYVGGAGENPATPAALDSLQAPDADGLAAEGYVLAAGRANGRPTIVLDGHDATGTFYAVQTLRQLIERRGQESMVPGVVVRDWPAQAVRGVIEGFYGTPWSD